MDRSNWGVETEVDKADETGPQFETRPTTPSGDTYFPPVDTLSSPDPKKDRRLPVKKIIIIGIAIIIGAIGILFALAYLLPEKQIKTNGDIVIGDTTITQEHIAKNYEAMDDRIKNYPEETFGEGDIKDIARRDLIKNAALKEEAKRCNVVLTASEKARYLGQLNISEDEAQKFLDERVGPEGSFARVRNENMAYMQNQKLQKCILISKSITYASIQFDVLYFHGVNNNDPQGSFDAAKERMKKDVLPLFEKKLSYEEMKKYEDPFPVGEDAFTNRKDVLVLNTADWQQNFFSDVTYGDDFFPFDTKEMTSANKAVANLKNVGDYTGVIVGQNGLLMIIRLDSKGGGTYGTWDDFFEAILDKYAYTNVSKVAHAVKQFARTALSYVGGLFVEDAFAANCWAADGSCNCRIPAGIVYGIDPNGGGHGRPAYIYTQVIGGGSVGSVTVWQQNCGDLGTVGNGGVLYPTCYTGTGVDGGRDVVFNQNAVSNYISKGIAAVPGHSSVGCSDNYCWWADPSANGSASMYVYATYEPANQWKATPQARMMTSSMGNYCDNTGVPACSAVVRPKSAFVKPGETVRWVHNFSISDGDPPNIQYGYRSTCYNESGASITCPAGMDNNPTAWQQDVGQNGTSSWNGISASGGLDCANGFATNIPSGYNCRSGYTVPQDAAIGTTYCRTTVAKPRAHNNSGEIVGAELCAKVPYDWKMKLETKITWDSTCGSMNGNCLRPGDTLTFTHTAQQMGPTRTNAVVNFSLDHPTAASPANSNKGAKNWVITSPHDKLDKHGIENLAKGHMPDSAMQTVRTETRKITQDDVGKYLCSQIIATPGGGETGAQPTDARYSESKCVYIPYDYELTPNTSTNAGDAHNGNIGNIGYDDDTVFQARIGNNQGNYPGPTKSRIVDDWEAFIFIIPSTVNTGIVPTAKSGLTAEDLSHNVISRVYFGNNSSVKANTYETIGRKEKENRGNCKKHDDRGVFNPEDNVIICETDNLVQIVNTLDLGERICFAVWTSPFWAKPADNPDHINQSTTNRSYSTPTCLTVSKSPQIQLKGSNSKSGAKRFGQTELSITNNNNTNELPEKYQGGFTGRHSSNPERGSWSQQALLSGGNGPITHFGSAGFTLNGNAGNNYKSQACKLLFANTPNGGSTCTGDDNGKLGINNRIIALPKIAERSKSELEGLESANKINKLTGTNATSINNLNDLDSGVYYTTNSLTIAPSKLDKGKQITIVAISGTSTKSTITITGNIETAATNYTDLKEIPSLTIIADNIYVAGPTTNLFGTYIAKDRFNTCNNPALTTTPGFSLSEALAGLPSNSTTNPTNKTWYGACQNKLTINGAVISKERPDLRRVYGADRDDKAMPSEILNYTPNLYLTPYTNGQTGNANNWKLTDLRQLPARM